MIDWLIDWLISAEVRTSDAKQGSQMNWCPVLSLNFKVALHECLYKRSDVYTYLASEIVIEKLDPVIIRYMLKHSRAFNCVEGILRSMDIIL